MISNYYKTDSYIDDLLQDVLKYGERMTKERPSSYYEMIGRLFIMFGVICTTAGEVYELEKESRRTLLDLIGGDYERRIAVLESLHTGLKRVLGRVPLFRDRDYQKYPQVAVEDILSVKEEFLPLEQLPFCGDRKAQPYYFDATRFAYKMYDIIFLGLEGIVKMFQGMYDHQQMLPSHPEMRAKRWQRMMDDYREHAWEADRQQFLKRRDAHISQYGCDKASLKMLLNQVENEVTNPLIGGMLPTFNWHYLHQEDHVTFIFENRDKLTRELVIQHLKFIHIHELLKQEIALYDLRQPAVGAYADLFTNRAAQELADLLAPIIARNVDFRHHYHYAALAMAMRDTGLIYADRRNGTAMVRFINEAFREHIHKSTLFRYLNRYNDFEKIKDQYEVIRSIINQALGRASKKDYFCQESSDFIERLTAFTKAL